MRISPSHLCQLVEDRIVIMDESAGTEDTIPAELPAVLALVQRLNDHDKREPFTVETVTIPFSVIPNLAYALGHFTPDILRSN